MTKPVAYTDYADFSGSSALSEGYYDALNRELYIAFHSGTLAGYSNVPPHVWQELTTSPSAGKYYTYNIRNHFKGVDTNDVYFLGNNALATGTYQTQAGFVDGNTASPVAAKSDKTSAWVVRVNVTGTLEVPVDAPDFNAAAAAAEKVVSQMLVDGASYIEGVNKA